MAMVNMQIVSWITPGFITRIQKRFSEYEPDEGFPPVAFTDPKGDQEYAALFGKRLSVEADVLMVITHGASPDGAGPMVISPSDRRSIWEKKLTVASCLQAASLEQDRVIDIKAKGVIDLSCNREFAHTCDTHLKSSSGATPWLNLGDNVEWFIAAAGQVTDRASGRALQAALAHGNETPELILESLRRRVPKGRWGLKMRNKESLDYAQPKNQ